MRTAQALLFLAVALGLCVTVTAVSTAELGALTDLYYSTGGSGWYNSTNWLEGDPCSNGNWFGVDCSGSHVMSVNLEKNGLDGQLSTSIGDLFDLEELHLSGNELQGTLPTTIGDLRDMALLDVGHNLLTGTIPESLGALLDFSLVYVDLSHNGLTGFVPDFFDGSESELTFVNLSGNAFFCPIPAWANYTGATCAYWDITAVTPTCIFPHESWAVYGQGFFMVEGITCQITAQVGSFESYWGYSYYSYHEVVTTSPAIVVSDTELLCEYPESFSEGSTALFSRSTLTLIFDDEPVTLDLHYVGVMNPQIPFGESVEVGYAGSSTLYYDNHVSIALAEQLCMAGASPNPWRCSRVSSNTFEPPVWDPTCGLETTSVIDDCLSHFGSSSAHLVPHSVEEPSDYRYCAFRPSTSTSYHGCSATNSCTSSSSYGSCATSCTTYT